MMNKEHYVDNTKENEVPEPVKITNRETALLFLKILVKQDNFDWKKSFATTRVKPGKKTEICSSAK